MPETDHRIYLLAGAALFAIGFYSLLVQAHLLRRIMALNVMGSGVFLVYLALGAQTAGVIPDPVPQAMVLTGIVVSVCATGLALALADRVQAATGKVELGDDEEAADAFGRKSSFRASITRKHPPHDRRLGHRVADPLAARRGGAGLRLSQARTLAGPRHGSRGRRRQRSTDAAGARGRRANPPGRRLGRATGH